MRFPARVVLVLAVASVFGQRAMASSIAYNNATAFLAAAGPVQTLDFEAQPVGTLIPSGSSLNGLTFTYSILTLTMQVANTFSTSSGTHYLGLNDQVYQFQFFTGDTFTVAFPMTTSFGLYIATDSTAVASDFSIVTPPGTATGFGSPVLTTGDSQIFFLGIVSDTPFASAQVVSTGGPYGFNVDDISFGTPEPSAMALSLSGGAALLAMLRKRKKARPPCRETGLF